MLQTGGVRRECVNNANGKSEKNTSTIHQKNINCMKESDRKLQNLLYKCKFRNFAQRSKRAPIYDVYNKFWYFSIKNLYSRVLLQGEFKRVFKPKFFINLDSKNLFTESGIQYDKWIPKNLKTLDYTFFEICMQKYSMCQRRSQNIVKNAPSDNFLTTKY